LFAFISEGDITSKSPLKKNQVKVWILFILIPLMWWIFDFYLLNVNLKQKLKSTLGFRETAQVA
jgi:hypothetical protein